MEIRASRSSRAGRGRNLNRNSARRSRVTGGNLRGANVSNQSRYKRGRNKNKRARLLWKIWEEEHEKWIDGKLKDGVGLDDEDGVFDESVEPSPDLTVPLLRYQKKWLAWALKQEESPTKGGLLADEIGMGKTVQPIALVLTQRDRDRSAGSGVTTPTLVVCPKRAVSRWVGDILRSTKRRSTNVLVYGESDSSWSLEEFNEYDFVIITRRQVEAEYRKYVAPPRQRCPDCGKMIPTENSHDHYYVCRPKAAKASKKSKKQKKRSLAQKKRESASATDDIGGGKSGLHSVRWNRIIFDEAHFVKKIRRNTTAKAFLALDSLYKWALRSGPLLDKDLVNLYTPIRFLQIVPYSYFFCKGCDRRTLDDSSSRRCPVCQHSSGRHFCWWEKYVATPIGGANATERKRAMTLLKHKILKSVLLRQTEMVEPGDGAATPG